MKNSLDDVIKGLVFCSEGLCDEGCPYFKEDRHFCQDAKCAEALGYLKKYREEDKNLGKALNEACNVETKYFKLIEDLERNEPLSWGELKTMIGRPVWIEEIPPTPERYREECGEDLPEDYEPTGEWFIIREFSTWKMNGVEYMSLGGVIIDSEEYGVDWQAFRKER